jgi:hypothetical protein
LNSANHLEASQPRALRRGSRGASESKDEDSGKTAEPEDDFSSMPRFPADTTCTLAKHLTQHSFDDLSQVVSTNGVQLADVIRAGTVIPECGIGAYACDAESYETFKDVLHPMVQDLHGIDDVQKRQPRCLDAGKLQAVVEDADVAKSFLAVSIRATRSVQEFCFPPSITQQSRDKLEQIITQALSNFQGQYVSLSQLYKQDKMAATSLEGDKFRDAAGCNRDWPLGRGVFYFANQQCKVRLCFCCS